MSVYQPAITDKYMKVGGVTLNKRVFKFESTETETSTFLA